MNDSGSDNDSDLLSLDEINFPVLKSKNSMLMGHFLDEFRMFDIDKDFPILTADYVKTLSGSRKEIEDEEEEEKAEEPEKGAEEPEKEIEAAERGVEVADKEIQSDTDTEFGGRLGQAGVVLGAEAV